MEDEIIVLLLWIINILNLRVVALHNMIFIASRYCNNYYEINLLKNLIYFVWNPF